MSLACVKFSVFFEIHTDLIVYSGPGQDLVCVFKQFTSFHSQSVRF